MTTKVEMEKPCAVCGGDHFSERFTAVVGGKPQKMLACPIENPDGLHVA